MKTRLSMEAFRSIHSLIGDVSPYAAGRVSASKCRELVESMIYDGLRFECVNPVEYGGSETDLVEWVMKPGLIQTVESIAEALPNMTRQRVAEICARLVKQGRIVRVGRGEYQRKGRSK